MRGAALIALLLAAAAAAAPLTCVPPASVLDAPTDVCCLDQPPAMKPDSSAAFMSGVLAHFSYPTSFDLPLNCSDACVDFQPLFTALAESMGGQEVAYVNGAQYHLNAMVIQTNSSVWLVFRGTEWPSIDPIDIKQDEKTNFTNVTLAGTPVSVHEGVWADLTEVYPDLVAQLNAFGAGTERDLKITGHSLGGILSGLTAARLAADGVNVSAVYTWASARSGDKRFAELYKQLGLHNKTLRFSNQGDLVPLGMPFALTGYHHVGQLVYIANGTCSAPDPTTEQIDDCAAPGLTRTTTKEPGMCRDQVLPYMEQFCAQTEGQLGGKDQLQAMYNEFMYDLFCKGPLWNVTKNSLENDPSWCCMFEYALQLAGGVMDDMVMQVGMQHGMPSYIASADACVGSSDTAEQVIYCMESNPDSAALFAAVLT